MTILTALATRTLLLAGDIRRENGGSKGDDWPVEALVLGIAIGVVLVGAVVALVVLSRRSSARSAAPTGDG